VTPPRKHGRAAVRGPRRLRSGRARRAAASAGEQNVLIGGSSWKYEGWLGQVYSRERYLARGRFSPRLFQSECLSEYAETFPPSAATSPSTSSPPWNSGGSCLARTPSHSSSPSKCRNKSPARCFRRIPRYGSQGGKETRRSWDAGALQEVSCARCCHTAGRPGC